MIDYYDGNDLGRAIAVKTVLLLLMISCPGQLNRSHCRSLSESVDF